MTNDSSPWRALGGLATVGITLVVATALATVGGYFLDGWLGTKPLFTLIGLGVGIATGFREFFRAVRRWNREEDNGG
ncbi:MAG TPA: AtpZ/AtpI family protein [Candidatus Methylomirabilis sp.]|nr:AtpZ/AtpI family protein [Candidatus Methylomirabilis sp.]